MKTVKEVAEIAGISIRTLRYYDEIDLLKPAQLSKAGYRLYDEQALEKLQQILFLRELEISLADIKIILTQPDYGRMQILAAQKILLEKKQARLSGLIEWITDVIEGNNSMSFEAFCEEDFTKIIDHSLAVTDNQLIIEQFGSLEDYRAFLLAELSKSKQANAHFIQLYGSREKALQACLQQNSEPEKLAKQKQEIDDIYQQFSLAMVTKNSILAQNAVKKLTKNYQNFLALDNARALLLELADSYLHQPEFGKTIEEEFGTGLSKFIGHAIQQYYGI